MVPLELNCQVLRTAVREELKSHFGFFSPLENGYFKHQGSICLFSLYPLPPFKVLLSLEAELGLYKS